MFSIDYGILFKRRSRAKRLGGYPGTLLALILFMRGLGQTESKYFIREGRNFGDGICTQAGTIINVSICIRFYSIEIILKFSAIRLFGESPNNAEWPLAMFYRVICFFFFW